MNLDDPFDLYRSLDPDRDPTPESAARLVDLAIAETRTTHADAKLDAGGGVRAMARWRYLMERDQEDALKTVLRAASKAVASKLVAGDATGDTVAIPVDACRIIEFPADLTRESTVTILAPSRNLAHAMTQTHHVILDARLLPAGSPLLAIPPVEIGFDRWPSVFVGSPYQARGLSYPGCTCSLAYATEITAHLRACRASMDARLAEEKRKTLVRQEREDKEAAEARESARLFSKDPTGSLDDKVKIASLERRARLLLDAAEATAKRLAEADEKPVEATTK